jgi:NTE family protein
MTKFSLFSKKNLDVMFQEVYEYTCEELESKGYSKDSSAGIKQ